MRYVPLDYTPAVGVVCDTHDEMNDADASWWSGYCVFPPPTDESELRWHGLAGQPSPIRWPPDLTSGRSMLQYDPTRDQGEDCGEYA